MIQRAAKILTMVGAFLLSGLLAHQFGSGGLWYGFQSQLAVAKPGKKRAYDLTGLKAVNKTLEMVKYGSVVVQFTVLKCGILLKMLNAL